MCAIVQTAASALYEKKLAHRMCLFGACPSWNVPRSHMKPAVVFSVPISAARYFAWRWRSAVYFDSEQLELRALLRRGAIAFYRWGTRGRIYGDDNTPGWLQKFPEWIKAECWTSASRSRCVSLRPGSSKSAPCRLRCYFELKRSEFMQGLIADDLVEPALVCVTVPAPAEHADEWQEWPRIVRRARSAS
jgi:hypothetical protein